jgi:hypothetical protein
MTKALWVLIILAVVYVCFLLFQQWDKARLEHDNARRQAAATAVTPEALPGMPYQLDASLKASMQKDSAAFRTWLKTFGPSIQDPRKAWIELDFCVAIARENPAEAKRIFAGVKGRVPPASPVWSKMKELEKTFE